jgi:hypothetical protein
MLLLLRRELGGREERRRSDTYLRTIRGGRSLKQLQICSRNLILQSLFKLCHFCLALSAAFLCSLFVASTAA